MHLLLRRSPLAFPGGSPGYNQGHVAASPKIRFLGVAQGANFTNLLVPSTKPTIGNAPTAATTPAGPAVNFSSASAYLSTTVPAEAPTAYSVACIITPFASIGGFGYVGATGALAGGDVGIVINSSTIKTLFSGAVNTAGQPAYTINTPYFFASSVFNSSGTTVLATVQVNLLTGSMFAAQGNGTLTLGTTSATFYIGSSAGSFSANANIHALMYSVAPLTLTQLKEWANAPWDLWYPPTLRNLMFNGSSGASGVAATAQARAMVLA